MAKKRLYLGDVFAIPLPDGRVAYGQYVHRDHQYGYLVNVFNHIDGYGGSPWSELRDELVHDVILFGPILIGFGDVIRSGEWTIVGKLAVDGFEPPGFVNVLWLDYEPRGKWSFWDGQTRRILGKRLPKECRDVELLVIWDPLSVAERIATGKNPYGDMVRKAAVG